MSLLNKKKDPRLVGTYLSPQSYNYLTLYSVVKSKSKAMILKESIEEWTSRQETEAELIKEIAKYLSEKWLVIKFPPTKYFKPPKARMTFEDFKGKAMDELEKKGLTMDQVDNIMSKIKE